MTKPLKPIFVEFKPVAIERLIASGASIFPELESTKLHIDGSMKVFLEALVEQYAIEKLTLVPKGMTSADLQEYYEGDLILRTQVELLTYLLEVNKTNAQTPTPLT